MSEMNQPMPQQAPPEPEPDLPTQKPVAPKAKRPGLLKGVNRGPVIVILIFLGFIFELALFQLVPTAWAVVLHVVVLLVLLLIWMFRRWKSRRRTARSRATSSAMPVSATRSSRMPIAGREGQMPRGGLFSRLRGGTRGAAGRTGALPVGARGATPGPSGARMGGAGTRTGATGWKRFNPFHWLGRTGHVGTASGGRPGPVAGSRPGGAAAPGGRAAGAAGPSGRSKFNPLGWFGGGRRTSASSATPRGSASRPTPPGPRPASPAGPSRPASRTAPALKPREGEDMGLFRPRRPSAPAARPTPRPAPAAGGSGGSSTGGHGPRYRSSNFEGMSAVRFITRLPEVAEEISDSRTSIEARARATEALDLDDNTASELWGIAAQMRRLEEQARQLQAGARRRNQDTVGRYEAPRKGSHAVQATSDNTAARRDM